jgi:REP element-mobilizing transposase RayT
MSRPPRVEYAGAFYHVIARGNRQQPIFHGEEDYRKFLDSLDRNVSRYHFHLFAYVLMPNHFHLLLEQEGFPLPPHAGSAHGLRSLAQSALPTDRSSLSGKISSASLR